MSATTRPPLHAPAVERTLARLQRCSTLPWLHGEVARRMDERLAFIRREPRSLLVWSAVVGDGRDALQRRYPRARCLCVDAAGRVDAAPLRWWQRLPRPGSAPAQVASAGGADLLWSNLLMHLAVDPDALLTQWRRALEVDGFVMWSALGPRTVWQLHALYRELGGGSPGAALTDMHDWGDAMVRAGFADPVMDQESLTLTWSDGRACLNELRQLGANLDPGRFSGLRTPRWRERLEGALRERATPDGRVALEFEIVYGHAFNPAPRLRVAARTEVALDEMRNQLRRHRNFTR